MHNQLLKQRLELIIPSILIQFIIIILIKVRNYLRMTFQRVHFINYFFKQIYLNIKDGQKEYVQSFKNIRPKRRIQPQDKQATYFIFLEKNCVYYKVAWEGYDLNQATWEPVQNLAISKQLKREMQQFDKLQKANLLKNQTKKKIIEKNKKYQRSSNLESSQIGQQEKKIDNLIFDSEQQAKEDIKAKSQAEKGTSSKINSSFQKNEKARLQKFKKGFFMKKEKPLQNIRKQIIFQRAINNVDTIITNKKPTQNPVKSQKQEQTITLNISQSQSDDESLTKQGGIDDLNSQVKIKGMLKLKDSFLYLVQEKGKSRLVKRKDMLVCYPYELICFYQTRINIEPAEIDGLVYKQLQKPSQKPKFQG